MAMSTGGGGGSMLTEINVTPLVDVMLVLLIIFMVTAPMLQTGVDVDLPQTVAPSLEDPEGKLVLSINGQGKIFLGGTPITWETLGVKLSANERVKTEKALYIEADQHLDYGVVVTAMALAKEAGVEKVMMLTDPTQTIDPKELDAAAGK